MDLRDRSREEGEDSAGLRQPAAVARVKLEEALNSEALLVGRGTYEEFAALWP